MRIYELHQIDRNEDITLKKSVELADITNSVYRIAKNFEIDKIKNVRYTIEYYDTETFEFDYNITPEDIIEQYTTHYSPLTEKEIYDMEKYAIEECEYNADIINDRQTLLVIH